MNGNEGGLFRFHKITNWQQTDSMRPWFGSKRPLMAKLALVILPNAKRKNKHGDNNDEMRGNSEFVNV